MIEQLQAAVRPIVTLMVTSVLCYGFVVTLIGAEAFLGIVCSIVGYWFSQRERTKANGPAPEPPPPTP